MEKKEFVYEVTFPEKTNDDHAFVEQLWARRKVGYMLDQIRANGEKPELVNEVVALAKKYGITTPYTSYLIVPDAAVPVAAGRDAGRQAERAARPSEAPAASGPGPAGGCEPARAAPPADFGGGVRQAEPGRSPAIWNRTAATTPTENWSKADDNEKGEATARPPGSQGQEAGLRPGPRASCASGSRRPCRPASWAWICRCRRPTSATSARLDQTAIKNVYGRNCLEFGGVWIDEGFDAKMPTVDDQGPERRLLQAARPARQRSRTC